MISETDKFYLRRCLQLAAHGKQSCSPNPMVGAVIVHHGRIIGEGWHRKAGEPHAEPNAINSVKDKSLLRESVLYVSLEPCSHYGKTPPCVELIIREHIPRVVIGTLDPFPLVAGRGVKKLLEAGVEVEVGVEEESCRELNKAYFHFLIQGRPYVILKWAQTADGFIDMVRTVEEGLPSLKISTPFTQMLTHKLRSECDAILIGTNTALLDDPGLNVRSWSGKNPIRLVIDRQGVLPERLKVFDGNIETIVFSGVRSGVSGKCKWLKIDFSQDPLGQIVEELKRLKVQRLLVEGGTLLHESFMKGDLWDEIQVETSTIWVGKGVLAPNTEYFPQQSNRISRFGDGPSRREIRLYQRAR